MAYDTGSDRVILFGGERNPEEGLSDTWAYDLGINTWLDMSPAQPSPSGSGPMAYDIESDRTVMYISVLGYSDTGDIVPGGETWEYDLNTNTWTNMAPLVAPFGLLGAEMVYDAESDRMILFGGLDVETFEPFDDTWTYDLNSNTWSKMDPEVSPPARNFPAMAYDDSADRVILFGGYPSLNDTWSYDFNTDTWEPMEPADKPSRRLYCDMVYDPVSGRMVLFGGASTANENPLDDTWAYDYGTNTWTELSPETHPSERGWYAAVYSSNAQRVLLFGGGRNRWAFTDETWTYDPGTNTWRSVDASS
jgi:N-acetylneuraminic acid mutarotase